MQQAAVSRAIQYRTPQRSVHERKAGRNSRSSSRRTDAYAFLRQRIESIPLAKSYIGEVNIDGLYNELVAINDKLSSFTKEVPCVRKGASVENIADLLCEIEARAERWNLSFEAKMDDDKETHFVAFKEATVLANRYFIFYIAPADYLPDPLADLYRRFMRFLANSLGISIMPYRTENYYLSMLLDMSDDEEDEVLGDEYNTEDFKEKFKKVDEIAVGDLRKDIECYRKTSNEEYLNLLDIMLEGMDILPAMNLSQFDFDPVADDEDNGSIKLYSTLCVLYSSNDGVDDELMNWLNSDCYSGLEQQGWNRWIFLTPETTKEEWSSLVEENDFPERFDNWADRFYTVTEKFDNYNQNETNE